MTPTLPHCVWSLPPKGALAAWGGPAPLKEGPHAPSLRVVARGAMPPEVFSLGGPAPLGVCKK